ncbi:MAG TPA: DUF4214 domain-containing protein [Candidatus Dormibacteraeota bacterium]|nr:DUF4214 domain-containing protein [Candidatus Dormibacteraeota bacterium]
MRLSGSRFTMGLTALLVGAASVVLAIGSDGANVGAATAAAANSSAPFEVVVQTMDSCRSPLDGAKYVLYDHAGNATPLQPSTYPSGTGGLVGTCVLQQGNCATVSKGCLVFRNVPPGDYRLRQTQTPAGNLTNPDGYAPCNSGSACRWETADVTVNPDGSVAGQVTNMAPTAKPTQFPNDPNHAKFFAGTTADPIVFHDFGLAHPGYAPPGRVASTPCDSAGATVPDGTPADADDWSTGTPSSSCRELPTGSTESSCKGANFAPNPLTVNPASWNGVGFPWQCATNPVAIPAHLISIVLNASNSAPGAFEPFTVTLSSGGIAQSLTSTYTDANGNPQPETVMTVSGGPTSFTVVLGHPGTQTIRAMNGSTAVALGSVVVSTGNGSFVGNLYHDVLGRNGDAAGISYWSQRLAGGASRASVASFFVDSTEAHGHIVDADYQLMLGRTTDPGGRDYWVGRLNAGAYNETLLGLIGGSTEFYNLASRGQGNDTAFVKALYQVLLSRTPQQAEVDYWVHAIATGTPRSAMGNNFAFSHEFHTTVVSGWYSRYLHRGADAPGLAYWSGNLDHGQSDDVGAVMLLTSDEYFAENARY